MSKADLTTEQRMDDARKVIELSEMLRSGRRKYLRHKHHGKGFQLSLSGLHEDPATVHTLKEESECDIKGAPEHEGPDALDSHLETIHSGEKFSRELRKSTIMRQQFSEDHRLHKHRRKVVKSHAYFTELFETAGPFPDILDELEMLLPQRSEEPQTHGLTPHLLALSTDVILSSPAKSLVVVWTVFLVPPSRHAMYVKTPVRGITPLTRSPVCPRRP